MAIERSLGRIIPIDAGVYSITKTYQLLDYVRYDGATYICKKNCKGQVPLNNTEYWKLIAEDGSSIDATAVREGTTVNVSIFNPKTGEQITSFSISDGTGGDMYVAQYATNGLAGVVDKANSVTVNAVDDNTLELSQDGKIRIRDLGWGKISGKPFNKIGEGLVVESDTLKASVQSWDSLNEKPFSSVDSDDFTVEDGTLKLKNGVAVPTYYVEITEAPNTSAKGITIENMKNPCKLIVRNVNNNNSNIQFNSIYINGYPYQTAYFNDYYKFQTANATLYGQATTSMYRSEMEFFITTAKNGSLYAMMTQVDKNTLYSSQNFLAVLEADEITSSRVINLGLDSIYMLVCHSYHPTSNAIYGCQSYMIYAPNSLASSKTVKVSSSFGGIGSSGQSVTGGDSIVTIKPTTSSNITYTVRYTLYVVAY